MTGNEAVHARRFDSHWIRATCGWFVALGTQPRVADSCRIGLLDLVLAIDLIFQRWGFLSFGVTIRPHRRYATPVVGAHAAG